MNEEKTNETMTDPDGRKKSSGKKWDIIGGIAVVLIALIVGIGIYNTSANRLSRHLDLGNRYLEEQNFEQAIVEFDKAIAIDPMCVDAYLGKAQAYEGLGDVDKAVQTLEEGYERTGDEILLEEIQRLGLTVEQEGAASESLVKETFENTEGDGQESDMGETDDMDRTESPDIVIEWEDAALEALIRKYLGKPEEDILKSDVSGIEDLSIIGSYIAMPDEKNIDYLRETERGNIETLNDIRHFSGLEHLHILNNQISDISALGNLSAVSILDLSDNQISDISALSNLPNLGWLDLSGNQVSDISALGSLTSLDIIYMGSNQISDISALSNLLNLIEIDLSDNQISDISAFSSLTNLKVLDLRGNNISDISALSGATKLYILSLTDNPISDYSPVSSVNAVFR